MLATKPNSYSEPREAEFSIRFGIMLAALIALTIAVYSSGISGPLLLDDYRNLSPLGDQGGVSSWSTFRQFVFGNPSGPSGRPVSMLSFLIDTQDWPPNTASLKYTNIMIHLLSGLTLCWFASELFKYLGLTARRSALLGLLVAALWLLHPMNGSTTLYIVQRMTQLMTLFGLSALLCYLKGRQLVCSNSKQGLVLLCFCLFPLALLSVLSKENGALLLLLIISLEFSVFRIEPKSKVFLLWFRVGVVAPLVVLGLYLLWTFPDSLVNYEYRHFSLIERLFSESRILVIYLSKIFLPINVGVSLFHDDLPISTSLLNPLSTLLAILLLAVLAGVAWLARKTQPMLFLGIAWFFSMHLLESTFLPLELYFEHRNYMAMIGPIVASVWYLNVLLNSSMPVVRRQAAYSFIAMMLIFMTWQTWQNSSLWGNGGYLLAYWAESQPDSIRAQITYADFLAERARPEESLASLKRAHEIYPREITTLLHMWNRACESGLAAPYTLEEIKNMDGLEFYHNDVNYHLRRLVENLILSKCSFPDPQTVIAVFEAVGELPLADARAAGFHVIYSDLFVSYRQLDPALIQLRYAFDRAAQPQIPIRQAMLSASAGNNADALMFLERARAADRDQSFLLPSFEEEIARMEADISARLDNQ
jgi:protein O-mannosyl-transferase